MSLYEQICAKLKRNLDNYDSFSEYDYYIYLQPTDANKRRGSSYSTTSSVSMLSINSGSTDQVESKKQKTNQQTSTPKAKDMSLSPCKRSSPRLANKVKAALATTSPLSQK